MSAATHMPQLLSGRTAIVTAAGAGVGRGVAQALADAGANVIVAVRRVETGEETATLIADAGGIARVVQADVSKRGDVERTVAEAVAAFGGLDIVVNNAASALGGKPTKLEDITAEMWAEQSAVALDAPFYFARAVYPHLKSSNHGRFFVMSSTQGLHGGAMNPAYPAAKNGLRGFVKALAREWGPDGISVLGVAPAALTEPAQLYLDRNAHMREAMMKGFAMRRLGDSRDDIGGALVAMCSDQFRYVTGLVIPVDGGNYTLL